MRRYFDRLDSDVISLWRTNTGAQRAYLLATISVAGQSLAMLLSDPQRTSGAPWRTINELGGPDWFGGALLLITFFMALAPARGMQLTRVALLSASAAEMVLAASFFRSVLLSSQSTHMTTIVVLTISLWMISHAEMYRTARR